MKQESSVINPYNGMFGQQGWICPKCGRVYSPFTQMCLFANPIIQILFLIFATFLIRPLMKKD